LDWSAKIHLNYARMATIPRCVQTVDSHRG
jgi:hypothetical protein